MSEQKSGAFTGEISASMLRELFVRYVVIGHSERRQIFGESDSLINRKVHAAHEAILKPILCIGETLAERDGGQVEAVLSRQLRAGLAGLEAKAIQETVVAYEPVWAIGTGRHATPAQAQAAHAFIRREIADIADEHVAERVRLQYGGSVKTSNCRRPDGRAGHRRGAGGRRESRSARFRRDHEACESGESLARHILRIVPATP